MNKYLLTTALTASLPLCFTFLSQLQLLLILLNLPKCQITLI